MKAILVRELGAPEVMKLEDIPQPKPAAGQVLVRVKAAGVNPVDTYMRSGAYPIKSPLPYTPGTDAAGTVEAVGAGVTSCKPGERVYVALSLSGTYAEFSLNLESQVHPLPERASFAQGAGVWVPCGTAFHALRHFAKACAGETLLVHGASGGVGIAAVQFGRALGMTVFGTVGTDKGAELVKREGAHEVFNHRAPGYQDALLKSTGGRGVDVILEMLANVNLGADLKLLARRGRVVVIGCRGDVTISPRELMGRDASIHALVLWNISEIDAAETHAALVAGLENGTLRPVVGKELPLAEAPRAHTEIMEPGAFGKIVLIS
jgi:NADPH2:quinone reductase